MDLIKGIPSTRDLAELSKLHYGNNNDAIEKKFKNYKVDNLSDENVLGIHDDINKRLIINHKGSSKAKDFISDAAFTLGLQKYDPQYQSRVKQTKKIVKKYPDYHKTITGHSLGASTAIHAIDKSASLAKNINRAELFNPASITIPYKLSKKKDMEHQKKLDNIIIHKNKNDKITSQIIPYGKKRYVKANANKNQSLLEAHSLNNWIR